MTSWTQARLDRLFQRYADRYWPRGRRLRRYRVVLTPLDHEGAFGMCEQVSLTISIDVAAHKRDDAVRSTLLHEMIHAAVGCGSGHGSKFFAEMERLLVAGAPLLVGLPENPEGGWLETVPARFARCRALLAPHYARRARMVDAEIKANGVAGYEGEQAIAWLSQRAEDAAFEGMTWPALRHRLQGEFGLYDLDGRPRDAALVASIRRAHRRGLRQRRDENSRAERP